MWWKIALVIVLLPVALLILVTIVGLFLPRAHTASRTVRYKTSVEDTWAVISDFASHADWRAGVRSIERLDDRDGRPAWREIHRRGDRFDMQVIAFEPPTRMVTQIVDHKQFGGTWTWTVEPDEADPDGACSLTIREDGEIYNPLFRFVARFIIGYRGTMDGVHRDLATHLGGRAS